jgi:hypothetical protein
MSLARISLPVFITLFFVIYIIDGVNGLDNGVGRTPPMGWNSWNRVSIYFETIFETF